MLLLCYLKILSGFATSGQAAFFNFRVIKSGVLNYYNLHRGVILKRKQEICGVSKQILCNSKK